MDNFDEDWKVCEWRGCVKFSSFFSFKNNDISRFGSARKTEGSRIGFCEAYERACNCAIPNDTTNGQEDGFSPVYEGY